MKENLVGSHCQQLPSSRKVTSDISRWILPSTGWIAFDAVFDKNTANRLSRFGENNKFTERTLRFTTVRERSASRYYGTRR